MLVNMHEAKTHLSRLVERAAAGEEIIIGKAGKPMARLIPYQERQERRQFGRLKGRIWIADDFDETPEWLIKMFEGEGDGEDWGEW
jgi:prevent-host-death family protein